MVSNTTKNILFVEKSLNFALSVYYILKYEAFFTEAYSFEIPNMYAPIARVHFTIVNWTDLKK